MRLPNRVVLDDRPFIHPLLETLEEGRAAGVILISGDIAEVLEWRHGELLLLPRIAFDAGDRPGAGSAPAAARRATADDRARRSREQRRRFVEKVAIEVAALATRQQWERAIVSGDDRLTVPLVRALPEPLRQNVIRDPRDLIDCESRTLTVIVQGLLKQQRAGMDLRLTHDPELRYVGAIGEDGRLSCASERRPMARNVVYEPRLTERMVERSLATGARVTPVSGEGAALLADMGGVAARLRW